MGISILEFFDDACAIKKVHNDNKNYGVFIGFRFSVFKIQGLKDFFSGAPNFET